MKLEKTSDGEIYLKLNSYINKYGEECPEYPDNKYITANGYQDSPDESFNLKGEKGDKPDHKWEGKSLSFQKPDGSWGESVNLKGDKGDDGWSPKLAIEKDNNNEAYLKLIDWIGGEGNKPDIPSDNYIGESGFVKKENAINIRGPKGEDGIGIKYGDGVDPDKNYLKFVKNGKKIELRVYYENGKSHLLDSITLEEENGGG